MDDAGCLRGFDDAVDFLGELGEDDMRLSFIALGAQFVGSKMRSGEREIVSSD